MVFAMRKAIHRFSVSVNCGSAGGSGKNYRDDGFLILRESYSESEGPRISDKRAFPATLTPGATFRIPFFVDKYAANKAHWLRFKAQNGSASGRIGVALDGVALDPLCVSSDRNAYIWIPRGKFTIGDHVLTLSRTDGGPGNVVFDVIELGGA